MYIHHLDYQRKPHEIHKRSAIINVDLVLFIALATPVWFGS